MLPKNVIASAIAQALLENQRSNPTAAVPPKDFSKMLEAMEAHLSATNSSPKTPSVPLTP